MSKGDGIAAVVSDRRGEVKRREQHCRRASQRTCPTLVMRKKTSGGRHWCTSRTGAAEHAESFASATDARRVACGHDEHFYAALEILELCYRTV